jgi:hypothetical protein
MENGIRIVSVLLFSGLMAFVFLQGRSAPVRSVFASEQEHPDSDIDLIFALDGCIQHRFEDVDKNFGIRRITKEGETPHRFKPENAKEFDVVRQLEKYQVKVALYLAGRSVLGPKPDEAESSRRSRKIINGPVFITTKGGQDAGLPNSSELWDQAQRAMVSFQTSDTYDFNLAGWRFTARPVRAIESCLQCHLSDVPSRFATTVVRQPTLLKVGDPLGIMLYAYKH